QIIAVFSRRFPSAIMTGNRFPSADHDLQFMIAGEGEGEGERGHDLRFMIAVEGDRGSGPRGGRPKRELPRKKEMFACRDSAAAMSERIVLSGGRLRGVIAGGARRAVSAARMARRTSGVGSGSTSASRRLPRPARRPGCIEFRDDSERGRQ